MLVPFWYNGLVATNLRLDAAAEEALRNEARRTGRSQQDILREAVGRHLGTATPEHPRGDLDRLIASGSVRPPRTPYRKMPERLRLPEGVTTADILMRDDRI